MFPRRLNGRQGAERKSAEGLRRGNLGLGEGEGGGISGLPPRSGVKKFKRKNAGKEIAGKPENLVLLEK